MIDHPNVTWTCAECGLQKETPWGVGLQQEGWLATDNGCICFELCPEHNPKRTSLNYAVLEEKLFQIREKNNGAESEEEDLILDQMEDLWWEMSQSQRDEWNAKPPRTKIT